MSKCKMAEVNHSEYLFAFYLTRVVRKLYNIFSNCRAEKDKYPKTQ